MKDKKRMFDYFEINDAKEISEKDCKKLKKIYKANKGTMSERKKSNMIVEVKE